MATAALRPYVPTILSHCHYSFVAMGRRGLAPQYFHGRNTARAAPRPYDP